jgi:hypothetical protein
MLRAAAAIGAEVEEYMKKKIRHSGEPLGKLKIMNDFLPPPEKLVLRDDGVKVTISLSKHSVDFLSATRRARRFRIRGSYASCSMDTLRITTPSNRISSPSLMFVRGLCIAAICISASGCILNPAQFCDALAPPGWARVPPPPGAPAALSAYLPLTPYTSSSGRLVRSTLTLWYQRSAELMACMIDRRANDACSIQTADFQRTVNGWSKVSTDAVLCNVAVTHGRSQP